MKKIAVFASGLLFILASASAQSGVKVHVIKEGETLSQLAKKYGTTVGDIMRLNKMTSDSKLSVNEEVKIPVGDQAVTTSVPSTHVVEKGETLYQLSRKFGLTVNQIRDWNNITGNNIQVGQTLRLTAPSVGDQAAVTASVPSSSTESSTPVATPPVTTPTTDTPQNDQNINPATTNATGTDTVADTDAAGAKQRDQSVFDPNTSGTDAGSSAEGAFATAYKSQANGTELITKGSAGEFKSASGWKDGKYFILMNEVAPGTLVKVQTKGKTIYAKVLWNLGNVKENAGLSYRISDAAASSLGLSGEPFDIIVSYFKQDAD